jgi:hypothetical protein
MRAELCERITDKEEFAVEEQGARGGDARDCRDERQGYLRDKVGKLSWKHCAGVGALRGPVLRALLAGREREVVAVAGVSVMVSARWDGVTWQYLTKFMRRSPAEMLPFEPGIV